VDTTFFARNRGSDIRLLNSSIHDSLQCMFCELCLGVTMAILTTPMIMSGHAIDSK
jgi:hypothetical protein